MLLLLAGSFACSSSRGQSCPDQAESVAVVRFVDAEAKAGIPLYAEQLPGLREAVISLTTRGLASALNADVPPVEFYRVVPASYELRGSKVVREAVQLDNGSEWIVAVNCQKARKLLLEGSREPLAAFNEMIKDLNLHVADAETALGVFDFFLQVTRGSRLRWGVVSDEMKLESVALDDFRLRFPETKRKAAFSAWWAGVPIAVRKALAPPKAAPLRNGFNLEYFSYSEGIVSAQSLTMSVDGTVAQGKPRILSSR